LKNENKNSYEFLTTFRQETLNHHNEKRKNHQVHPLVQDHELDEIVQKYAEKVVATQKFEHSHAKFRGYHMGENVYMLMLHV